MNWEPRPLPEVTPETAPYWRAATEGRLLLGECVDCGTTFFYFRALCPECLGDDVHSREAAGTGIIYSYSSPEKIEGWPDEHLPLVVAYVELDEGPRIISNIVDCNPADVSIGAPVTVDFMATNRDDVAIPVFYLEK